MRRSESAARSIKPGEVVDPPAEPPRIRATAEAVVPSRLREDAVLELRFVHSFARRSARPQVVRHAHDDRLLDPGVDAVSRGALDERAHAVAGRLLGGVGRPESRADDHRRAAGVSHDDARVLPCLPVERVDPVDAIGPARVLAAQRIREFRGEGRLGGGRGRRRLAGSASSAATVRRLKPSVKRLYRVSTSKAARTRDVTSTASTVASSSSENAMFAEALEQ